MENLEIFVARTRLITNTYVLSVSDNNSSVFITVDDSETRESVDIVYTNFCFGTVVIGFFFAFVTLSVPRRDAYDYGIYVATCWVIT